MILPKDRDPRLITVRRGGTLTDADHHLLALWAANCAEHVLHFFETERPRDHRPRQAIEHTRAWVRGEIKMMACRAAGGRAMSAARDLKGAARNAAYAAGQAAVTAHVAAHDLGAAAYAIKAVKASVSEKEKDNIGWRECQWQRDQLPGSIRELVIEDQKLRNHICWFAFNC
ncbi:putative immunity protein [Taibaiella koreensis]|uniref:putative immunity protein n=1 Tax=Taibaiella koreensis TaxID=1268548 RepID=UPI000E5A0663